MPIIPWENVGIASGAPLSALAVLQPLAQNALTLDSMTRKGRRAWTDQVDELANGGANPSPLCDAAFFFRTGLTTLTIAVFGNPLGGGTHTMRVRLNGTQQGTLVLNNTEQSLAITISSLGFADGSVVTVEIDVQRTNPAVVGVYALRDAYVSPMSAVMGTSWPGLPTFGAISQGNLQLLVDAQQWCFDRMNLLPMPVPQGFLWRSLHNWPSTRLAWRGSLARSNGANRLYGVISYLNVNTEEERMRLLINESEVDTTPDIGPGESGIYEFDVDLSGYTNEQVLRLRMEQIVTAQYPEDEGAIGTRWNLRWFESSQSTWSYSGLAANFLPLESMTFSTLQSRLNAIVADVEDVYDRIEGSDDMWDRQRLFRRSPTAGQFQKSWHARTYVARSRRFTDGLIVRGKNVKLIWGPVSIPAAEGDEDPYRKWSGANEQDIISGDFYRDVVISFNSFADLIPGTLYYLIGEDLVYAAETWQ